MNCELSLIQNVASADVNVPTGKWIPKPLQTQKIAPRQLYRKKMFVKTSRSFIKNFTV